MTRDEVQSLFPVEVLQRHNFFDRDDVEAGEVGIMRIEINTLFTSLMREPGTQ